MIINTTGKGLVMSYMLKYGGLIQGDYSYWDMCIGAILNCGVPLTDITVICKYEKKYSRKQEFDASYILELHSRKIRFEDRGTYKVTRRVG